MSVKPDQPSVEDMKEQTLQILRSSGREWLYQGTIAEELEMRFPICKRWWQKLVDLVMIPSIGKKELARHRARITAQTELIRDGRIISQYGDFKLA